jgi:hypothetical protein
MQTLGTMTSTNWPQALRAWDLRCAAVTAVREGEEKLERK